MRRRLPEKAVKTRGRTEFPKRTMSSGRRIFASPPRPPLLLFQPNTHSLGNLLFSPQASSEIESKMALA